MAVTWTITNRRDAVLNVHPALTALPPHGTNSYSGSYRAIRCTVTAAGTYVTGGDLDFAAKAAAAGIKHLEGVLVVADAFPPIAPGALRFRSAVGADQGKMSIVVVTTGAELGNGAASAGAWEVILLGRSG